MTLHGAVITLKLQCACLERYSRSTSRSSVRSSASARKAKGGLAALTRALQRVDELVLQRARHDVGPLRHVEDLVREAALRAAAARHITPSFLHTCMSMPACIYSTVRTA